MKILLTLLCVLVATVFQQEGEKKLVSTEKADSVRSWIRMYAEDDIHMKNLLDEWKLDYTCCLKLRNYYKAKAMLRYLPIDYMRQSEVLWMFGRPNYVRYEGSLDTTDYSKRNDSAYIMLDYWYEPCDSISRGQINYSACLLSFKFLRLKDTVIEADCWCYH